MNIKEISIYVLFLFALLLLGLFTSCKKENLPTLTTISVSKITDNSADCGGNITSDGNSDITSRGVVWSETSSPTVENHDGISSDGNGVGTYKSELADLKPETKYYVRAYASNNAGVAYGNEISFTTVSDSLPVADSTVPVADFTASETSLSEGGTVNFTDVSTNNPSSWEWSFPGGNPSSSSQQNPSVTYNVPGNYTVTLIATNSKGSDTQIKTDYIRITTNGVPCTDMPSFIDSRDGTVYPTVQIGNQCWMAKNLAYLPSVTEPETGSVSTAHFYVYDYYGTDVEAAKTKNNYSTYGVLYNWSAAMDGQASSTTNPSGVRGICPEGWHLPSDDEWKELEISLGMTQTVADAMAWRGTSEGSEMAGNELLWSDGLLENSLGFRESGFTSLPGGCRNYNGFVRYGIDGNWWSATELNDASAWHRSIYHNYSSVYRNVNYKELGYSVRCLMDTPSE
ncbi:MAG: PKD domain-containing protein [Bacteroidales bacterium]|nr:PKD domain-containing protein [Bacteroidales bacterium]